MHEINMMSVSFFDREVIVKVTLFIFSVVISLMGIAKASVVTYECQNSHPSHHVDSFILKISSGHITAKLKTTPLSSLFVDEYGFQDVQLLRTQDQILIAGNIFDGFIETYSLAITLHDGGKTPSARVSSEWGGYELFMDSEKFTCSKSF